MRYRPKMKRRKKKRKKWLIKEYVIFNGINTVRLNSIKNNQATTKTAAAAANSMETSTASTMVTEAATTTSLENIQRFQQQTLDCFEQWKHFPRSEAKINI